MLEQISEQLQKDQTTVPVAHGPVVLFLVFAFMLSGWLLYRGIDYQVRAHDFDLQSQLAVELTQTD